MNWRSGLKLGVAALAGLGIWSLVEPRLCRVTRIDVPLPRLPAAFDGLTIAFLADTHHGPSMPLSYLRRVVAMTNVLEPDLVALGGDYIHRSGGKKYIRPGIDVLDGLQARLGRFAVLGNHDIRVSRKETSRALADCGITELTNAGVWLTRDGARLRLCGVDDFRFGRPNLRAALGDSTASDAVVLIAHNPDFAQTMRDRRVSLILSGHTHGGQVVLPFIGAPMVPSKYGQKYRCGLVQAPFAPVFVTRGVGVIAPPVRFRCRPEIALITLRASAPLPAGARPAA